LKQLFTITWLYVVICQSGIYSDTVGHNKVHCTVNWNILVISNGTTAIQ